MVVELEVTAGVFDEAMGLITKGPVAFMVRDSGSV